MKVTRMIEFLNEMNPNDDIAVLWWERQHFGDADDPVPEEVWSLACDQFDEWDDAGNQLTEWLQDTIIDCSSLATN